MWSRRAFLKSSAAVTVGAYGLSWGLARAADIPLQFDGSKFQLKAPEPKVSRAVFVTAMASALFE